MRSARVAITPDGGAAALMRGMFHTGIVQQIANRLFLDVLFQASATTGKRIPLYLAVHEARTPMFLMRHGCRLTHFLISYISIVVPTTALTPTPFHCKCMHTWVRHGPRTGVCQDPIYWQCVSLGEPTGSATRRLDCWMLSGGISQPVSADIFTEFSLLLVTNRSSLPLIFKHRFLILHTESQLKHRKLQPST